MLQIYWIHILVLTGFGGIYRVFYIDHVICKHNFISFFPIWLLFPVYCLVALSRTYSMMLNRSGKRQHSFLLLFLIWGEIYRLSSLLWVFHIWPLLQWKIFLLFLVLVFYIVKDYWILSNAGFFFFFLLCELRWSCVFSLHHINYVTRLHHILHWKMFMCWSILAFQEYIHLVMVYNSLLCFRVVFGRLLLRNFPSVLIGHIDL